MPLAPSRAGVIGTNRPTMNPTVLTDLLGVLSAIAMLLDLAVYGMSTTHRKVAGPEIAVIALVNLVVIGLAVGKLWQLRAAHRSGQRVMTFPRRELEAWGGWIAVIAHVLAKLQYLNLVPRWDSGTYYGEVLRATSTFELSLKNLAATFRLAGHPSHAYGMYLAMGQILFPLNHYVMNAQNLVLSGVGIYCFWLIVRLLLPEFTATLRLIVTLAFAFNPLFFGGSLSPNADLSVAVCLLATLAAFLHHRPILFSFAGLCLTFSKEPGTFLYALLLGLIFVFYALGRAKSLRHLVFGLDALLTFPPAPQPVPERGYKALLATLRIVALAVFPLIVFYGYHSSVPSVSWSSSARIWNDSGVLCFGLSSIMIRNVLYEALVLNFGWLPTLLVIAYIAKSQIWSDRKETLEDDGRGAILRVCVYLFALYLLLHCIYINYLNPRYVLALMPLGLIIAGYALSRLVQRAKPRLALASLFVVLCTVQTWRAFDPVSRHLWGTFKIGSHELIQIGGDLQGKADGMAYNAQFTAIERLYRAVNYWALTKNPQTVLLVGSTHYWLIYYNLGTLRVDEKTKTYTTKQKGTLGISLIGMDDPRAAHPYEPAVYIAMPWVEDVSLSLEKLRRFYDVDKAQRISYGGYYVDVYPLSRLGPHTS
jgi:hypothetical protein